MRCLRSTVVALAASALLASAAHAAPLKWHGTSIFQLSTGQLTILTGTGVATVNGSGGFGHLSTLRIAGGISGTGTNPVTDPEVTVDGIVALQFFAPGGTGTITGISGGPRTGGFELLIPGFSRICLFDPACLPGGFLELPFTEHQTGSTTIGFGVGGLITVGGAGAIRISVIANPWTLGTASALDATDNGGIVVRTATGFAHGPASLTSSTALPSGVVKFVTPIQVTTNITSGTSAIQSLLGRLKYHFVPEPGMLLLLGSGALALVLLGRHRAR